MTPDYQLLIPWPVVLVIEDCYVSDDAFYVLDAIRDLDDDSCAATIDVFMWNAACELTWRVN